MAGRRQLLLLLAAGVSAAAACAALGCLATTTVAAEEEQGTEGPAGSGGEPPAPEVQRLAGRGRPTTGRRFALLLTVIVVAAVTAGSVLAFFTATVAAGSNGAAKAATVNVGATPSASVLASVGREVTVSWGASTLSNGHAVDGYVVQRYPAGGGLPTISPYGTCAVTVSGTSCAEDLVPPGQWRYTVTPVIGTNWKGAESALSGTVTLSQVVSVSGSPYGAAAFTPAASGAPGSIAGFGPSEGVSYRLDSSTPLSGSPSSVAANGSATITALAIPNAGEGAHTVWALGNAASPSQASTAIVIDTTPPTVTATLSPASNGAGWNNTSVQVTLAANDGTGSGVRQIKYTTDGSDPTTSGTATVYSAPFTRTSTTTVKFFATDNAGNASAVQTQLVQIDTVPPTNGVSMNLQSGNALLTGTTLWYRGVYAGSFTLSNALTDTGSSGTASTYYAALGGSSSGWSFTPSSVTSGPPYVSNTFSWSGGASSSPSETVTGYDVASNFASTTLNLVNDSTGPTGGSVDGTGLVGTGSRYSTSTSLSIAFSAGTDAGVGLATSGFQLLRASAPLSSDGTSDGSCGSYGSYAQVGSNDPVSPVTDAVSDHTCYRYQYVVADKLGNSTTYTSPDIKVDTTGPSAPVVTLSGASGNTYISGQTVYTDPQAGKSGSFGVGATSSDADSGIQKVNFPTLTGYSAGGGDDTSSPYSTTYSWSGAGATASGSKTVTAYDNASLTAASSFTVTPDTTNPTITASAKKADNTTYTAGTWTNQTVTVHYTCSDAGAGVASCPADQVYSADGSTTASATATDNVGNTATATFGLVQVDKTNPTISASAKNADNSTYTAGTWTHQTVTVHYTCSDALSGIASCPTDQVFSAEGTTTSTSGTATDNAGNSASASFGPIKIDKTVPANSLSLTNQTTQAGPAASTNLTSYLTGTTLYYDGSATGGGSFQLRNAVSDALSGPASSAFGALGGTSTGWSFTSSTVTTPSGGPYVSNTFGWTAGTSTGPTDAVTGADAAGNTTATTLTFTNDKTNPTTPTISFPTSAVDYTNSTWNAGGGGCGTSSICGTASDAGSGIGKVQLSIQATSGANSGKYWNGSSFSSATEVLLNATGTTSWSLAFPASNFSDAFYAVNVYAIDNVGNFASKSATFDIDNVAPASSVASVTPSPNGVGWEKANTTVALQATDGVSGVATIFWSESGAQTASGSHAGGGSFNTTAITAEGTTTVTYHAVDNAGNVEADNTYVVKLDKTAPGNSLTLVNGSGGGSLMSGSTVYYRGSVAGQFQIQNAVSDGLSGPASSQFAALGGTSTGWSFTPSTVSSPSGGPYVSNAFSWSAGATSSPTEVATGADVAGNTTAAGTLTFTNDSTAPTTTATLSPAANGAGWNNTSPVQVTLSATDAGAGVSQTKYTTDGTDPSTSGTAVVYSAPFNVTSTTTVKYYSTDRIGNAESTKTQQVNIDTQAPNAPTMTNLPYAIKNGQSVSVTSASDNGASGVASVTYYYCAGTSCTPSSLIATGSTGPSYSAAWNSQPADGTYTVAAKATDAAGNVSGLGPTQQVIVENSVAPSGLTIANGGGTAGKPDSGDTIAITYSGPLAVSTVCGAWSGDSSSHSVTDASVTITDSSSGGPGGHDGILSTGISSATCGTVHVGTVNLIGNNYVTGNVTFSGSTLAWDPSTNKLTITLGTPSNTAVLGLDTTTRKPTYAADSSINGSSGVAISTANFTPATAAILF